MEARTITSPIINGHRYSWASIEIVVNGFVYVGITRISYGSSMEPGSIYGSDSVRIGRTPGQSKHRCSFDMYRREWTAFLKTIGQSFGRKAFDIRVQYAEGKGNPTLSAIGAVETNRFEEDPLQSYEGVTTDAINGCRIIDYETGGQDGPEAIVVHVTCDPLDVRLGSEGLSIDDPPKPKAQVQIIDMAPTAPPTEAVA